MHRKAPLLLLLSIVSTNFTSAEEPDVDFNRSIQPILSDNCYKCHGPDGKQRKTDLRLDVEESAYAEHDGKRVIVPRSLANSELYRRITSSDPDQQMPPPDSDLKLSKQQVALVRKWIEQGAKWKMHWSFEQPRKSSLPTVQHPASCLNEIDYFVQRQLDQRDMRSVRRLASRPTLIRRLSLDLTGVPPTPQEVDAFLADKAAGAYERLVDRLLSSPRFGERMASRWLDAARYADTSGYQNDGPRYMWRWRDWVIEAINKNMPFDQFTIEQLAGDMLPQPTLEQQIASGFNRNHRGNAEGGIIPAEYAVEYVVDRVDTTATIWLGLTMGCARCHDHKYDPIKQREFYQVYSYFNNVPENGRAVKEGNSPPFIKAPTRAQREDYRRLNHQIQAGRGRWNAVAKDVAAKQRLWERQLNTKKKLDWTIFKGLVAHYQLQDNAGNSVGLAKPLADTENSGTGEFGAGVLGKAALLDGSKFMDGGDAAKFGYFDKFSIMAWVNPAKPSGTLVSRMVNEHRGKGYYVHLEEGKIQVNLVSRWLDDSLRVESVDAIRLNEWTHVGVVYDGSRVGSSITIFVNGSPVKKVVNLDGLNQTFALDEPLRIGGGSTNFTGLIDEVRLYRRPLSPAEVAVVSTREPINELVAVPDDKRTAAQTTKLNEYFRRVGVGKPLRDLYWSNLKLELARRDMVESWPTVMVMKEMSPRRPTHVLRRGQYDLPQQQVQNGVPQSLLVGSAAQPKTRLEFARWLVSRDNPLTARVTVNRYWQMLFGSGLVSSAEDFGAQGARPSHPQLLDWLAVEYMENGWDTKAIIKKMVTSASYRRSSSASVEAWQADPANRLLARGPRVRLPAETIRDQALAAAGLLRERLGGPSVKPYQPPGLWKEIATDTNYEQSQGADLYRRGLYTYWKRTVVPPQMSVFDASSRETCVVRQSRTNTPLQALATLNDVTYVEAARVLAERAINHSDDHAARIEYAFRLVLARRPTASERKLLRTALERHRIYYWVNRELAEQLTSVGEMPRDKRIEVKELAAYTNLTSMILNLDEAITKE